MNFCKANDVQDADLRQMLDIGKLAGCLDPTDTADEEWEDLDITV